MNQEKKRILEMVQNGKLSAQEAIILLEALDKDSDSEQSSQMNQASSTVTEQPEQKKAEQKQTTSDNQHTDGKTSDESIYSQIENAGEKIFEFVNSALKKIKHMDLQFNQSVDIPHVFQQDESQIERIDIDVANGPVKIITWDQSDVRIECQAKVYRADDREDARAYFIDNTIFSIDNGLLCFATQSKWMRVETVMYVPKQLYKKLSVRIFNGGLSGEQLRCQQLSVKTTNGKVELSNIEGENFRVETVNGQISFSEAKADQLEAETVNGAIDVVANFRTATLQSFNGNISCSLSHLGADKLEVKAVTGNIQLHLPEAVTVDGDIRSNLGNYKLELDGIDILHEKKEIIQKQVTFKRTGTDERVFYVVADTKTGSILIKKVD